MVGRSFVQSLQAIGRNPKFLLDISAQDFHAVITGWRSTVESDGQLRTVLSLSPWLFDALVDDEESPYALSAKQDV